MNNKNNSSTRSNPPQPFQKAFGVKPVHEKSSPNIKNTKSTNDNKK